MAEEYLHQRTALPKCVSWNNCCSVSCTETKIVIECTHAHHTITLNFQFIFQDKAIVCKKGNYKMATDGVVVECVEGKLQIHHDWQRLIVLDGQRVFDPQLKKNCNWPKVLFFTLLAMLLVLLWTLCYQINEECF